MSEKKQKPFLFVQWLGAVRSLSETLNLSPEDHKKLVQWFNYHMFEIGVTRVTDKEMALRMGDETLKDYSRQDAANRLGKAIFDKGLFMEEFRLDGNFSAHEYSHRVLVFGSPNPNILGPWQKF